MAEESDSRLFEHMLLILFFFRVARHIKLQFRSGISRWEEEEEEEKILK